jgi:hypothetical protein
MATEVPRSQPTYPSKIQKTFLKNYSSALEKTIKGFYIFRGLRYSQKKVLLVKPSKIERTSTNTVNIYTALTDCLPSWRGYPKRSRSIICAFDQSRAMAYMGASKTEWGEVGSLYCVFPKNGAKIGVCPSNDIYYSFPRVRSRWGAAHMGEFNTVFDDLFQRAYEKEFQSAYHNEIGELNGDGMDRFLREMERDLSKSIIDVANEEHHHDIAEDMETNKFDAGVSWLDYFDDLMNPVANGFILTNIDELDMKGNLEVWTDADSFLINMSHFDKDGNRKETNFSYVHDFVKKMTGQEVIFT